MLLEPRMILRALDGKIQSNLKPILSSGLHQIAKVLAATQFRVNRVMPTVGAADGVRATRVIRPRLQRVIRPLAMGAADRMDRRKIQHIETHVSNHR